MHTKRPKRPRRTRSIAFRFWLSPEEHRRLEAVADDLGVSKADALRLLVSERAKAA